MVGKSIQRQIGYWPHALSYSSIYQNYTNTMRCLMDPSTRTIHSRYCTILDRRPSLQLVCCNSFSYFWSSAPIKCWIVRLLTKFMGNLYINLVVWKHEHVRLRDRTILEDSKVSQTTNWPESVHYMRLVLRRRWTARKPVHIRIGRRQKGLRECSECLSSLAVMNMLLQRS